MLWQMTLSFKQKNLARSALWARHNNHFCTRFAFDFLSKYCSAVEPACRACALRCGGEGPRLNQLAAVAQVCSQIMNKMTSGGLLAAFSKGKVNAYLERGYSVRGDCRAIGVPHTIA